jgi:hypothetical protein
MPVETFFWNNFGGGWSPNDDAIKGGGQNLLKMTNLELDRNGSLSLQNGTTVKQSIGDSADHTLYSRFLQGTRHDYTSLTFGKIFRDATQLTPSGSTSRTGFSTAFDDTLITSGTYRVKDSGTGTPPSLGIGAPTGALTTTQLAYLATQNWIATGTDVNTLFGTAKTITAVAGFDFLTQWETKQSVVTVNGQPLHTFNFGTYDSANTTDTTILTQTGFGSTTTVQDPNDVFNISFFSIDGAGLPSSSGLALAYFYSLSIKIYLSRPVATTMTGGTVMTIPSDYFQYTLTAGVVQNGDDVRVISNNEIVLAIRRQQFQRIGNNSALDWNTVVGYEVVVNTTQPSGLAGCAIPLSFQGGRAGMISGTNGIQVQYAQMNVAKTSSYTAKSVLGPITQLSGVVNAGFAILAQTPTDPQVTNIWIFRQDNGLDQWYRVLDIPLANVGTAQIDTLNDDDALVVDITVDLNLVSTASSGITEDILEIIGPIEGRWYYFTKEFLYPSDIEDPDLTNVAEGIRTCGAQSEVFLWACKISEAQVLVGTSVDVYMFSGTFTTLPDGSIDVYYRPLGCKFPPIARSANVFSGVVYYLSMMGWTSVSANGQNQVLSSPGLDLLYQGEARYGYVGIVLPGNAPDSVLYPSCIQKAKLYCSITGTGRIEIYDFVRQYWRPCLYGLSSDCSGLVSTQDGQILGYYGGDNKLRTLWDQTTKLVDGAGNQNISILNVAIDGASPASNWSGTAYSRNRKDLSTFKSRVFTNDSPLSVSINTDQGNANLGNVSSANLNVEEFLDISQKLATCKWWQFSLSGSFSDFLLQDCSVDADIRPQPLTFVRGRNKNFETGCQKRIRTWPFVIDTRSGIATITPYVDNVAQPPVQFQTPEKTTVLYKFLTDVFGIDYGYTVLYDGTTEFEFYGDMPPEIVQTLPIAKRFDQIGPQEFFRYGKVLKLSIRLLPNDLSGVLNKVLQLPYTIYFNDQTVLSGLTIPVLNGVEGAYTIGVPKGTAGGIFRLELGPAPFDIHRFNIKVLVDESGQDTDGRWVSIG